MFPDIPAMHCKASTGPPIQPSTPGQGGLNLDLYTVNPLGKVCTGSGWTASRLSPMRRSILPPTSLGTFKFCRAFIPLDLDLISSNTDFKSTTFMSAVMVSIVRVLAIWSLPSFNGSRVPHNPEAIITPPPATPMGIGPFINLAETSSVSGTPSRLSIVLHPPSINACTGLVFPFIKQYRKTHSPAG